MPAVQRRMSWLVEVRAEAIHHFPGCPVDQQSNGPHFFFVEIFRDELCGKGMGVFFVLQDHCR